MKKRIVCLTLALLMSASQVVSVSASREDELREEQAITSQQLDATYSRMDELAYAKSQLENEISLNSSSLEALTLTTCVALIRSANVRHTIIFFMNSHPRNIFFLYLNVFAISKLILIHINTPHSKTQGLITINFIFL